MSEINALIARGSTFGNAFGDFADSYEEQQKIQQAQAYRNALLQQQQAQDAALAGRHKDDLQLQRDQLSASTSHQNRALNEEIRFHNAEIANSSRRAEPDVITEFKFALANGFKGNYADWLREKSGQNIDLSPILGGSAQTAAPPAPPVASAANNPGQMASMPQSPAPQAAAPQAEQGTQAYTPEQLAKAQSLDRAGLHKQALEVLQQNIRNEGEGREFQQEDKLRTTYLTQAKPFAALRTNYQSIQAASQDNTGASDIAMVYGFMKMLDPTSVVREGEFATAENAGGVPQQVIAQYNKVINGQRLAPEVRKEFLQQADRQFGQQSQSYGQTRKIFQNLATQYGLNPDRVAPDVTYGVQMPQAGSDTAGQRKTSTGVNWSIENAHP